MNNWDLVVMAQPCNQFSRSLVLRISRREVCLVIPLIYVLNSDAITVSFTVYVVYMIRNVCLSDKLGDLTLAVYDIVSTRRTITKSVYSSAFILGWPSRNVNDNVPDLPR